MQSPKLKDTYDFGHIWLGSIVAALCGLQFGHDRVVISGAKAFFEKLFGFTWSFAPGFVFIYFRLPETINKLLEQVGRGLTA